MGSGRPLPDRAVPTQLWCWRGGAWKAFAKPDSLDSVSRRLVGMGDDQGRIIEYRVGNQGILDQVMSNQSYDGNGNRIAYQLARYYYDQGIGVAMRGELRRVKTSFFSLDEYGEWQERILRQNDYTYDDAGNRQTNTVRDENGNTRTETYGYDALLRLTSVNYGDGEVQGYTFDPMGNRLTKTVNGITEGYSYNNANMLLTRGGQTYTNDAAGNTLSDPVSGRTMTWDAQNRMTACTTGGVTTNYTYGADGLRRRAVRGANTTDYILNGQSVVRELLNGDVSATYLVGPRGPEYRRTATGIEWYCYDGLGSVGVTLGPDGVVTSSRKYDVYGAERGTPAGGASHKFVGGLGHAQDDTGLVYMRARYYDPATGRFVSEDPGRDGGNWFWYASDAPTNRVDPDGRKSSAIEKMLAFVAYLFLLAEKAQPGAIVAHAIERIAEYFDPDRRNRGGGAGGGGRYSLEDELISIMQDEDAPDRDVSECAIALILFGAYYVAEAAAAANWGVRTVQTARAAGMG